MKKIIEYLENELGLTILVDEQKTRWEKTLPLYITATYKISAARLMGEEVILAQLKNANTQPTTGQMHKHLKSIRKITGIPVVLVLDQIESFKRKRLMEQQINFVVPFKQLFIPELMMASKEVKSAKTTEDTCFIPMAQLLTIYWLLSGNEERKIEKLPFNEMAAMFNANAMAITRAADNLANLDICTIHPGRPKMLTFKRNKQETWNIIKERHLWMHPVLKTVFTETRPPYEHWLKTNIMALTDYTNINPGNQQFLAIDKAAYQAYKKIKQWPEENKSEGKYAIEIWKYNPDLLNNKFKWLKDNIDPISLYFCFIDDKDERVEDALQQIERKFIW